MPPGATPPADHLQTRGPENPAREESRRTLGAIERDRSTVAKLLHDTACQSLSGLQLLGSTLLLSKNGVSEDAGASLKDLVMLLRQASAELRTVVEWLHPPVLRKEGLIVSLVDLCTKTSESIPCEFHCDNRRAELDLCIAEQFYQIAQAAVMEVMQRGEATRLEIALEIQSPEAATLSVWNDATPSGGGSESERVPFNEGLPGLRARAIGGRLTVAATSSGGTCVTCSVGVE